MELLLDSHFWVGVALVVFVGVLVMAGVHKFAWKALGDAGEKVRAQLAEADDLRAEAQRLLDNIKVEREAAELHAAEM
jgi:F-type H+-transporting ATPase subunit b